jgi:A/G-specific adenine glycosylase
VSQFNRQIENRPIAKSNIAAIPDLPRLRAHLTRWFQRHGRDLPWRRTHDAYAVMVSEFMLQQTQVATVLPYYERWLVRFPSFTALAAAEEGEVLHAWQGLGYYARARNLHRAAKHVAAEHGGVLPRDLAAIRALPGVGRYTAGAIASFAFDLPAPIVDANVARVLARLLDLREPIDSTRGLAALWATAEALVPRRGARLFNSALMELGALVCTPRQPQCLLCPVRAHCTTEQAESLPVKKARRKTVALGEDCAWIVERGRVLLEQQTGRRWRGMWKLPTLPAPPRSAAVLVTLDYPFTHHRVTLRVFAGGVPRALAGGQEWFALAELAAVALPSPHRRAVERLLAVAPGAERTHT